MPSPIGDKVLVQVAGSNRVSLTDLEYETKNTTKQKTSLPALHTHFVDIDKRACYADFGMRPSEHFKDYSPLSKSFTSVELTLKRRAEQVKRRVLKQNLPPEPGVTDCLTWSCFKVAQWIGDLGFEQYMDCFQNNFINGRKLIYFSEIKEFPKIGIYDFEHMKYISHHVREKLGVARPSLYQYKDYTSYRSVADPAAEMYTHYLQDKARNGKSIDNVELQGEYQDLYRKQYDKELGLPTLNRKWKKIGDTQPSINTPQNQGKINLLPEGWCSI